METTSFVRGIEIDRPAEEVRSFLRQVPNLPRWTGFFLRIGEQDGGLYAVETVIGPAKTRIEDAPGGLTIVSDFGARRETASIDIDPRGSASEVRFHLRLPADLPQARVDSQLARLEAELRALRGLLEAREHTSTRGGAA